MAELREIHRRRIMDDHAIPNENQFDHWEQVVEREKFADAVVVATLDTMHAEPAIALANKGYHILLEKPMSPDPVECKNREW